MGVALAGEFPYQTIADDLRGQIHSGQLKPGEPLPTEAALMRRFGVSRGTVRNAIAQLAGEGLVATYRNRHTVKPSNLLTWLASLPEDGGGPGAGEPQDAWSRSVIAQGRVPSQRISVEERTAGEQVARWLDIDPDAKVVCRLRVRCVDGYPYSLADSYYPHEIVAGSAVESLGDVKPGIYAEFDRLGYAWDHTWDRVTGRGPTPDESHKLRMSRDGHVLEVARRSFTATGQPVRLTMFILPTDRHDIEYRLNERHPS